MEIKTKKELKFFILADKIMNDLGSGIYCKIRKLLSFEIPSREDSLIARVPQTFRRNDILAVHRKAIENGEHNHIDSCTLMSRYGHKMNTIIGPMENIKITTPTDFFIFRAMVQVHENQQIFGF